METKKRTGRARGRQVSVLNWMGTLFLCSIPGVNLIALLCFAIFGKSPSKRHFAVAVLLWIVLILAAIVALLMCFPKQATVLAGMLRELADTNTTTVPIITPGA